MKRHNHLFAKPKYQREAIIAGCTEVPLVLEAGDIEVPLAEPLQRQQKPDHAFAGSLALRFQAFHSYRRESTGLAMAALID